MIKEINITKLKGLEGITIGKGTPLEEKITFRKDIAKFLTETFAKLPNKKYTKDFEWCEIEGKAEPYCMANSCFYCPANKDGFYYNPDSRLVQFYRKMQDPEKRKDVSRFRDTNLKSSLYSIAHELAGEK